MSLRTGHVGLNVTDLDRSVAFYQRVFGFEAMGGSAPGDEHAYALLGLSGELMVTLWQQSSGAFTTDAPGLHHLAFQVPGVEDLKRAEATLRELGATFVYDGIVPHREGAMSGGLFFTDPDGVRLEISAPDIAPVAAAPSGSAPTCGFF